MLRVVSIFQSISGEVGGFPQGTIAQFVRFGGCNLSCRYCDTVHTQDMKSGREMLIGDIAQILLDKSVRNVVLTGGEPLVQDTSELIELVKILNNYHFKISIETNGTISIPLELRRYCSFVMDYKLDMPALIQDLRYLDLGKDDFVKFPIADRLQLVTAMDAQRRLYKRGCLAKFAYSPIFDRVGDHHIGFDQESCSRACLSIINGLAESRMDAILNLQIHKIIEAE